MFLEEHKKMNNSDGILTVCYIFVFPNKIIHSKKELLLILLYRKSLITELEFLN